MRVIFAVFLSGLFISAASIAHAEPNGVWITEAGKSLINIAPCNGNNNPDSVLCSKIIWLKKPFDENGEPLRDRINENPGMRSRPILGMPILLNMRPSDGSWEGRVYNPEDGKEYRALITPQGNRKLLVKGCAKVLFNWVCREQLWHRASEQDIQTSGMPVEPQIGSN